MSCNLKLQRLVHVMLFTAAYCVTNVQLNTFQTLWAAEAHAFGTSACSSARLSCDSLRSKMAGIPHAIWLAFQVNFVYL